MRSSDQPHAQARSHGCFLPVDVVDLLEAEPPPADAAGPDWSRTSRSHSEAW